MDFKSIITNLATLVLLQFYKVEYFIEAILKIILHKLNGGSVNQRMTKYSTVNYNNRLALANKKSRIAFFVGYHKSSFVPLSNIEYLKTLKSAGFRVFYIHNGKLESSSIDKLSEICEKIVCRPNLGSDCGAWKDAFLFFKNQGILDDVEWILFCNDSNYCLGGDKSERFAQKLSNILLTADRDLVCLNKNYELWQHYQSFFLCVRRTIFNSRSFYRFWKNYIPLSHRYYAINHCEVKLTRRVLSKYNALVMYDASTLYQEFLSRDGINSISFLSFLPKNAMYLSECVEGENIYEFELQKILSVLGTHNPSHSFGILFVEYLDSPFIKKDLGRQGVFSLSQIQSLLTRNLEYNGNGLLLKEIMEGYISAGLNTSYIMYPRKAYRSGIVSLYGAKFDGYGNTLKNMGIN